MSISRFERLDPRTLLAAAAGSAFCFSFVRSLAAACACLAFAALLAALRRLSPRFLLQRLAAANVFIAFLWLSIPLSVPGDALAAFGPFSWTAEGVRLALLVTLKCNAVLLSFLALVSPVSLPRLGCALERLRVPPKLVFLLLFAWRHIHAVRGEYRRLQTAAALRGFVPRNSIHTYRTVGNMLGLTLVNAIGRSRRVYEAMLLRGFAGHFRTASELRGSKADAWFATAFFLVLGGILLCDFFPGTAP